MSRASVAPALVLLAAAAAIFAPIDAFLLAFSVLGPLHYLTELAWLSRRGFFVAGAAPRVALGALAVLGTGLALLLERDLGAAAALVQNAAVTVLFVAVAVAAVGAFGRGSPAQVAGALGLATLAGAGIGASAFAWPYFLIFGVLLPTLVHVVVFTVAFMADGCRRRRAPADVATLALFLVLLLALAVVPAPAVPADARWQEVIGFLVEPLRQVGLSPDRAPRLLAFVYLHHFLNWFEKTERIGWHRLPRLQLALVAAGWVICVGAYAVDLRIGLLVALLPNLAHVVMELPLNWRTFTGR